MVFVGKCGLLLALQPTYVSDVGQPQPAAYL